MNQLIDLTDEEKGLGGITSLKDFGSDKKGSNLKEENDNSQKMQKEVKHYEWIAIDDSDPEFNYIQNFLESHKEDGVNYKALDIDSLDPNFEEPNSYRGNVIDKILKSIAKDGVLKQGKRVPDDYDLQDAFVDDTGDPDFTMQTVSQLTPALDDFICHDGGIESFRRSPYYSNRIITAKKQFYDQKKQKKSNRTGKKTSKDPSKRKTEDPISRSSEEMKKVKKTPVPGQEEITSE
jgi:hypothetical protein